MLALALLLPLLTGCGAKPKSPVAPIRTHFQEAAISLPTIPAMSGWERFSFNDWERLRARTGLAEVSPAEWTSPAHADALATLSGWLAAPATPADAVPLAALDRSDAPPRWQAALDRADGSPVVRLVAYAAKDDRAARLITTLAPLGFAPSPPATAAPKDRPSAVYRRDASGPPLPALLDPDAAALIANPTTLVAVHDPSRIPDATAALSSDGAGLDTVPFFQGLVAGVSDVEAVVLFRIGTDGYRDRTAPPLDAPILPFDAVGAALHITDAGTQYVTMAFHCRALPGGRLPESMAEWWATRLGLDRPDPRVEYLEGFGADGWLFARYRLLAPTERVGVPPPGEMPFWQSATTWQTIQQRWSNWSPVNADPIPRLGT